MSGDKNSGRVTTREFYNALLAQNEEAAKRERRIMGRIEALNTAVTNIAKQPAICQAYFDQLDKQDEENQKRIDKAHDMITGLRIWEGFNTVLATVLGYFGIRQ